jgi:hypothetical protein
MDTLIGVSLTLGSVALFAFFWPRAGRPRFYDRSPFVQDMVPLLGVTGLSLGLVFLIGPFLK